MFSSALASFAVIAFTVISALLASCGSSGDKGELVGVKGKKWNPEKHPGHAAAALKVEEVYSGAEKLL